MLFADDSSSDFASAGSTNASFTMRWQSSNVPATDERAHVAAPARELFFLAGGDESARVKHDHVDPRPIVERGGDGAARVARRGDQDRQAARVVARDPLQRRRQEACTEVLERGGRPVEQLEDRQGSAGTVHIDQRRRKIERVASDLGQRVGHRVPGRKRRDQPLGQFGQARSARESSQRRVSARPPGRTGRRPAPVRARCLR